MIQPPAAPAPTNTTISERGGEAMPPQSTSAVSAEKKTLNKAILQAHHQVSLSIKDNPLSLLYKTALEAINAELAPELGEHAIDSGFEGGLDISPEATAERIVALSTGLFPLFQEQHPELGPQEQLDRFVEIISGGIAKGFEEARAVLDGLKVLEGDIATNIDRTFDLVQEGLDAFRARYGTGSDRLSDQAPGT
jgi:hypothetical protein